MVKLSELQEKLKKNNYNLESLTDIENQLFNRCLTLKEHKGRVVRHFKGKFYLILDIALHTETGEEMIVYKALYGECELYVRPIDVFLSKVDKEKYPDTDQEYRFEFVEL